MLELPEEVLVQICITYLEANAWILCAGTERKQRRIKPRFYIRGPTVLDHVCVKLRRIGRTAKKTAKFHANVPGPLHDLGGQPAAIIRALRGIKILNTIRSITLRMDWHYSPISLNFGASEIAGVAKACPKMQSMTVINVLTWDSDQGLTAESIMVAVANNTILDDCRGYDIDQTHYERFLRRMRIVTEFLETWLKDSDRQFTAATETTIRTSTGDTMPVLVKLNR